MVQFKNWIFAQLPAYFKDNDTYKDTNGKGLLERYLYAHGEEWDEEIIPYLTDFTNIIEPLVCDEKFLPLIGSILGYPPAIDGSNATYRKLLAYAVAIYKIKGTLKSYQILFSMLHMDIEIDEILPKKKITYDLPPYLYDETHEYDSDCDNCGTYNIRYKFHAGYGPINSDILKYIDNIICWLQPINAKKGTLTEDLAIGLTNGIFDNTFDNTFN